MAHSHEKTKHDVDDTFPRSIIECRECTRTCHYDKKYSILSNVGISDAILFKSNPNQCFMCNHPRSQHTRSINEKVIKQLFVDAKVNADADDICKRMKYLGGKNKQNKKIINVLYQPGAPNTPYIWMHILWKSQNYTSGKQKIDLIKMFETEFEPDYTLTNNNGHTIIHILCHNDDIIDDDTTQLLLLYFREKSKYSKKIKTQMFTSLCHRSRTPLHYAVENGKLETIQILIQLYDINTLSLKDKNKQTPMDVAKHNNHIQIMKYLDDYYADEKTEDLYHEKQELERCLLHSINALLQEKKYTSSKLDKICKEMAPDKFINPHKALLGTGNYDANVLIMALSKVNIDVQWFDARKINELNLKSTKFLEPDGKCKFMGFILNKPQKSMFKILSRRHWLTIKKIGNHWYNLDSKLDKPQKWNVVQTTKFLKDALNKNNAELMICRKSIETKNGRKDTKQNV